MTKSELVHRIEAYIPDCLLALYRKAKRYCIWKRQQKAYRKALTEIRKKEGPIRVLFIVKDSAEWKYDSVYRAMAKDTGFEPMILVCPSVYYYTEQQATEILEHTSAYFASRGYHVIKACEKVYDESIAIDTLQPDVVFYSSLWTQYLHPKYNEKSLRKYLKGYVNYGFSNTAGEWGYASAFHGLMWRYFAECEDIRQIAQEAQPREMQNIVVTGYPIFDEYMESAGDERQWKNASPAQKRIIWAPHHSIEGHSGLLQLSTFLDVADAMLALAEKYEEQVQFAFKPHPLLLQALYDHPLWGKERTDAYYKKWAEGKNTALVTGAYMDLFKSSDAMIHDCGSFIVEYLYTQKPVMYLGSNREEQSNIVGKKAYACHYHGRTIADVERFIADVVLKGNDAMALQRKQFYDEALLPPNGCSVAENIVDEIKQGIYG